MVTAPWWSVLVTPTATLLAFALGVVASWWSDKRRWAREDTVRVQTQQREDDVRRQVQQRENEVRLQEQQHEDERQYNKDRLDTYSNFLTKCDTIVRTLASLRKAAKERPGVKTAEGSQLPADIEEANRAVQKIRLISTPAVAGKADALWGEIIKAGVEEVSDEYYIYEIELIQAIRQEVKIDFSAPTKAS
jgi:hypothetical protein